MQKYISLPVGASNEPVSAIGFRQEGIKHALETRDKLADQFQIESVLGQGVFGRVYLARDLSLGVLRVIKELLPQYLPDKEIQRRFAQARAIASFNHPNIVTIYQLLTPPAVRDHYIVMSIWPGVRWTNGLTGKESCRLIGQ